MQLGMSAVSIADMEEFAFGQPCEAVDFRAFYNMKKGSNIRRRQCVIVALRKQH